VAAVAVVLIVAKEHGLFGCVNTSVCGKIDGSKGGTGGQGGTGGTGGTGGGGSFGIWEKGSTGTNPKTEVNVVVGSAGAAGAGASGSLGLDGSAGNTQGNTACVPCVCNYKGGNGGKGGTGGQGGKGGDGVAGTSAATVVNGTPTATLTATIPFATSVTLDNFSQRNNISGKMCNNSEIDIKNTTGSALTLPSDPAGLSIVYDLTPTTSSYSSLGTTKVTTNDANVFYNIQVGATVLNKFLYVATDNRSLPAVAITPSSKVICKGSSIDLSKTNSFDAGNIQQYEYIVFADGSNASTPYLGGTYNSSSNLLLRY
jgi:hypothetical protein